MLRRSVALAEEGSRAYDAVRNAGALAARLSHTGAFHEARHWGEWALRRFDASGLEDGQRRLRILNDLAFARLVTGQSAGLGDELWEVQGQLEAVLPDLAILFRQTLSELELVEGRPDVALNLARANVWGAPRRELGKYIVTLVRVLQELGRPDEAAHEAGLALDLSKDGPFATAARLALGMSRALRGEPGAAELLAPVMESSREPAERRVAAALYYLLATGVRFEALEPPVKRLFKDVSGSGLRLLSGPERAFLPVWGQVLAKDMPLRIRALSKREVFWRGRAAGAHARSVRDPRSAGLLPCGALARGAPRARQPGRKRAPQHPARDALAAPQTRAHHKRALPDRNGLRVRRARGRAAARGGAAARAPDTL